MSRKSSSTGQFKQFNSRRAEALQCAANWCWPYSPGPSSIFQTQTKFKAYIFFFFFFFRNWKNKKTTVRDLHRFTIGQETRRKTEKVCGSSRKPLTARHTDLTAPCGLVWRSVCNTTLVWESINNNPPTHPNPSPSLLPSSHPPYSPPPLSHIIAFSSQLIKALSLNDFSLLVSVNLWSKHKQTLRCKQHRSGPSHLCTQRGCWQDSGWSTK